MDHWARTTLEDLCDATRSVPNTTRHAINRILDSIENRSEHLYRTAKLESLAAELSRSTTLEDFAKTMWSITIETGFQNFIVFVTSQGASRAFQSRVCTCLKDSWVSRYAQMAYQTVDPVFAAAAQANGVYDFKTLRDGPPDVRAFWEDAEEYGIGKNGLCFSMTLWDGVRIGVSYLTAAPDTRAQQLIQQYGCDLQVISELAAQVFHDLSVGPKREECPLSVQELRFLHTLATSSDPEDAFKVTPGFGSNHTLQASIRSKLGVTTVFQAISLAVSRNWLDHLPFDESEVQRPHPGLEKLSPPQMVLSDLKSLAHGSLQVEKVDDA